jgi:hypothetical protein
MYIREYMKSPVITVTPDTLLDDALRTMHQHHIRRLPVVEDNKLVGAGNPASVAGGHAIVISPAEYLGCPLSSIEDEGEGCNDNRCHYHHSGGYDRGSGGPG